VRPLCILSTGDPVPSARDARGGFDRMIRDAAGGSWSGSWLSIDLREGGELPEPGALAGVIVTGSSASVTSREPWILRGEAWLRELVAADTPLLGICFGHQMLAQALGGEVVRNPRGREIGTVEIDLLADDPLLDGHLPPRLVHMTHVDGVARLPPGARLLARSALDRHAAFRVGRAWGVQFHPELDATTIGAYLDARRDAVQAEGLDWARLRAAVRDAPAGAAVIPRFVAAVQRAAGGFERSFLRTDEGE
jgi:GMP synthase (glutamine-hydrolysing)